MVSCIFLIKYNILGGNISAYRFAKKHSGIEFVDVGEQFAERAGTVLEQALALVGGGERCIAYGAARVNILSLPCEWRRPLRREPAIFFLDRDAVGTKIGDRLLAYAVRVSRQHDRGFDRAAMDAVAEFFRRE